MQYMGGKFRLRKDISSILMRYRHEHEYYVEPFCGGCNMLTEIPGKRIGADIHPYLIALWQAVSEGWMPPERVTRDEYIALRRHPDSNPVLAGYVGFQCSFGGKWFGGYSGFEKLTRHGELSKDVIGFRKALRDFPRLRDVNFICNHHLLLDIPPKSLIYCDPPYVNTVEYGKDKFDSSQFWQWVRDKVKEGHRVFVSEYVAPDDFVYIFEKQQVRKLAASNQIKVQEKLFIHESQV